MSNKINPDLFNVLRVVRKLPDSSQRNLAKHLGFSLGKLNYCIKGLKLRGLLKLKYFNKHPKKISMLYVLTPKGVAAKTKITIKFMKKKIKEYEELKNEIE
jgi:EPS-associated MarR family transcriptional regulator|tara:strand:+ start:93 stop:395 length:303 start_codon:yes stop_codon:yes gene_type:complete